MNALYSCTFFFTLLSMQDIERRLLYFNQQLKKYPERQAAINKRIEKYINHAVDVRPASTVSADVRSGPYSGVMPSSPSKNQ